MLDKIGRREIDGESNPKAEVKMSKTWAVSFGETERMDLERIVIDRDPDSALDFLRKVIYPKVKEAERPGSCFHDIAKPVDSLERTVERHKDLGSSK